MRRKDAVRRTDTILADPAAELGVVPASAIVLQTGECVHHAAGVAVDFRDAEAREGGVFPGKSAGNQDLAASAIFAGVDLGQANRLHCATHTHSNRRD
jgi:hypothetical protein